MQKHLTSFPADLLEEPASEEADCAGFLKQAPPRVLSAGSHAVLTKRHLQPIHPSILRAAARVPSALKVCLPACLESGSGLVDKAMENEKICEDEAALYSSRALQALRRSASVTSLVSCTLARRGIPTCEEDAARSSRCQARALRDDASKSAETSKQRHKETNKETNKETIERASERSCVWRSTSR